MVAACAGQFDPAVPSTLGHGQIPPERRAQRSVASVAVALALVMLAAGPPAPAQPKPGARKLDLAHIIAPPESGAIAFKYLADEVTKRSNGTLNVVFHGGTLLTKDKTLTERSISRCGSATP